MGLSADCIRTLFIIYVLNYLLLALCKCIIW